MWFGFFLWTPGARDTFAVSPQLCQQIGGGESRKADDLLSMRSAGDEPLRAAVSGAPRLEWR